VAKQTVIERIRSRDWVDFVDNETDLGHGYIVTLKKGYCFEADPGCGVRGFDSIADAEKETRACAVYEEIAS
jgi:hypothetical protein